MTLLYQIITVIHVIVALALIGIVLLQRGKGSEIGAAFGGGASGTLFGARGSASFLTRTTAILATIFFLTSLTLAYFAKMEENKKTLTEFLKEQEAELPPVEVPVGEPKAPLEVPEVEP